MSSERIGLQRETVDLQIKELTHEGGGSGLTQGIACGDVYFCNSFSSQSTIAVFLPAAMRSGVSH